MIFKIRLPENESPHESIAKLLVCLGVGTAFIPLAVFLSVWLLGDFWIVGAIVAIFAFSAFLRDAMSGKFQLPVMTWSEEQRRKSKTSE